MVFSNKNTSERSNSLCFAPKETAKATQHVSMPKNIMKSLTRFIFAATLLLGVSTGKSWGQTYILNDNFGGGTFGSSQSSPSSTTWSASANWTVNSYAYPAGTEGAGSYNVIKLSSSSNGGTLTTKS